MVPSDRTEFPSKKPETKRMLPSQIEAWVHDRVSRFAVLSGIDGRLHFTSQLVAIMSRLDYTPRIELLAGHERLDEVPNMLDIVTKHVGKDLLDDLDATLELAETDSRVTRVALTDESGTAKDGEAYVSEDGRMVYTDHEQEAPDLSADRGERWASW